MRVIHLLAAAATLLVTACGEDGAPEPKHADILLFDGAGTSRGDVAAIETVLSNAKLAYAKAGTGKLNAMSEADLRAYRLLIVPGGNFEVMGQRLSPNASTHVREAVQSGLNYLGVCAGALLAGDAPRNGFDLTGGVRFPFYAMVNENVHKSAVEIAIAGGRRQEHYWEDGPQLSGWGDVVARYPDGTPAVVEGEVGKGWVILTGTHPEAPQSWRRGMKFDTPPADSNAFAAELVLAALNRTQMPHE